MTGTTKISFDLARLSNDQKKHNCIKLHAEISIHTSKGTAQRGVYVPSNAQSDSFDLDQFASTQKILVIQP